MARPAPGPPRTWLKAISVLVFHTFLHLAPVQTIPTSNDGGLAWPHVERRSSGTDLRILCVGASITFGVGSTTGNGYREDLRDLLEQGGSTVHYVGTQNSGDMKNNANEGYPGRRIDQVSGLAWNSYGYLPNVICMHLGTNDFVQGYDPQTSANRMGIMIDQIYTAIDASTLVVVSKLLPNRKASTESGIEQFNSLLDGVVSTRSSEGKNVVLVDMHSDQFSLDDIGPDGTHPTDSGYQKMAGVWYDAINNAIGSGKVPSLKANTLSDTDNSNNNKCDFTPSSIGAPGLVQFGFGNKTAQFKSSFINKGFALNDTRLKKSRTGVFLVRAVDADGANYVHIESDGSFTLAYNDGANGFLPPSKQESTVPKCDVSNIRFADMNGDSLDDFICIDPGQFADVYYAAATSIGWSSSPDMSINNLNGANVYFGDVDGDGHDDVITVSDDGAVSVIYPRYNSSGSDGEAAYSTGWTIPDFNASSTYFFDVNGDGRADCVDVNYSGTMTAWLNYRGQSPLQPNWRANGIIKQPVGGNITSDLIIFGKIRGTRKTDFATLHKDGSVKVWENYGYLGYAWGEYVRYCDMTDSGSDSYMTLGPSGSLKLYQNIHDGGIHLKYGQILGDQGVNRADVRLADLNGDGRCDYIVLNNATGTVSARENEGVTFNGNASSSIALSRLSPWTVYNYMPKCDSSGVWFADVTGDGLSDYICVDALGNVYVGTNEGGSFTLSTSPVFSAQGEMTKAAGVLGRELISWADINGDGLADYLFFDPSDGSITARLNTNKGQSFGDPKKIYSDPSFVGGVLQFANLNGLGRADIISVNVLSAKGKSSANRCPPPTPPTGIGPNPNCADGTPDCGDTGDDNGGDNGGDDGNDNGNDQSIYPLSASPPSGRVKPTDGDNIIKWAGVGDSYSAGPGAGNSVTTPGIDASCFQNDGSYVVQLADKLPFSNQKWFYSCTGAKTPEVLQEQILMLRSAPLLSFATLSIGGNDVGFSNILKSCVLIPYLSQSGHDKSCDDAIEKARTMMQDTSDSGLAAKLAEVWGSLGTRLVGWTPYILQQSYPHFFSDDSWCNDKDLAVFHVPALSNPLLTEDLRNKLNALSVIMQDTLTRAAYEWNQKFSTGFHKVYIMDANDDVTYPNHRFCERGVTDLNDPSIYIFKKGGDDQPSGAASANDDATISTAEVQATWNASTCDQDPRFSTWGPYTFGCTYAQMLADGSIPKDATTLALPESVTKVFHPKSVGFGSIANAHASVIRDIIARNPSATSDGGFVQCLPSGDNSTYVSSSTAQNAIQDFCSRAAGDPDVPDGAYSFSNSMILEISPDYNIEEGCAKLDSDDAGFEDLCTASFQKIIQNCNTAGSTKQGGAYYKTCVTWQMRRCDSETASDCPLPAFPYAPPST